MANQHPEIRIKRAVDNWSRFCDLDPEDFDRRDVREIADRARVPTAEVWDYVNFWYLGGD